jgi:hypothetical protein
VEHEEPWEPQAPQANKPPPVVPDPRPQRQRRAPDRLNLAHITARKALKDDPGQALPAIQLELRTLLMKKVFRPRLASEMSEAQERSIVRSQMNVTRKVSPASDGGGRAFDKTKARLVVDGSRQDRSAYTDEETSSPTASTSAVLMVAQIAAAEGRSVVTLDIGSAYLNAAMPKTDPAKIILMRIDPLITSILTEMEPKMKHFTRRDGSLVVELDQALYGCIESALLWHTELASALKAHGFTQNLADICTFNKLTDGVQTTVVVYVDDLLLTSTSVLEIESTVAELQRLYKEVKISRGVSHHYLGMVLDFSTPGTLTVSQEGMVQDIVSSTPLTADAPLTKTPKTPAAEYLFEVTEDAEPLGRQDLAEFHTAVAKILFVSNRARPDLLTVTSFLTRRVTKATEEDARKLGRAMAYMNSTAGTTLKLRCTLPPAVHTYIDASFGVHPDRKSHTGVCVTLGTGMFFCKSTAQKINTTSSCESELVALAKGLRQSLWAATFLEQQGYPRRPVTVFQDNQSTIKLVEKGRSTSELTRHIELGYFWVTDLVKRGLVTIEYCPTADMVADLFTKPVQGPTFNRLRDKVMGNTPCIESTA